MKRLLYRILVLICQPIIRRENAADKRRIEQLESELKTTLRVMSPFARFFRDDRFYVKHPAGNLVLGSYHGHSLNDERFPGVRDDDAKALFDHYMHLRYECGLDIDLSDPSY